MRKELVRIFTAMAALQLGPAGATAPGENTEPAMPAAASAANAAPAPHVSPYAAAAARSLAARSAGGMPVSPLTLRRPHHPAGHMRQTAGG